MKENVCPLLPNLLILTFSGRIQVDLVIEDKQNILRKVEGEGKEKIGKQHTFVFKLLLATLTLSFP